MALWERERWEANCVSVCGLGWERVERRDLRGNYKEWKQKTQDIRGVEIINNNK